MNAIDRRRVLLGGAALGTLALPGIRPALAATSMRCIYWGSAERNRVTEAVIDLFEAKNPGVSITGELMTGSDYWVKLATAMAGRNIPDILQLEPSTISEFSGRGACEPLDGFVGGALDVSGFSPGTVDLTRVDGQLWGVGLGLNSFSMLYDIAALAEGGVTVPTDRQITWDEFAGFGETWVKNAPARRGFRPLPYGARLHYVMDAWLRQQGKQLYGPGEVGFTADDAVRWFAYWEDLRKAGLTVDAGVQSLDDNTVENSSLTTGKSAIGFAYSNQMISYQKLNKSELGITTVPGTGSGDSGHYYRPALIWCVGAGTANAEAAARFISFFVNDVEAGKILMVERGVPLNLAVREAILPLAGPVERKTVDYVNFLADRVSDYPPPAPIGSNEFSRDTLMTVADEVAFEKITPAEAGPLLVQRANAVLRPRA